MFSLILVLIAFSNCFCSIATKELPDHDNVYIDKLVRRYMDQEISLWNTIYASNASDRNHDIVNTILNKIRNDHNYFFQNRYLEHVMSVTYMSKFVKYVDFYNVQNYAEGYQHQILSLTNRNPQTESYMTLDMTFNVYNYTRADLLFRKISEDSGYRCSFWSEEMESVSHKLYMFYEILAANVLLSYMKSQRANMIQVVKNRFEAHDHEILRTRFRDMYNEIANVAKENIRQASRTTWICDRDVMDDRSASREVTNFIRGYVDNQINLNAEQSCRGSCSDYKFTRNYDCYNGTYCYEQKTGESDPICRGTVLDCGFVEEKLEICPSLSSRNRRYEYINYGCTTSDRLNRTRCNEDGRYFGQSGNCFTEPVQLKPFRNEWFVKCNYCFCYCDEQHVDSDRYFSLQEVTSDVRDNKVITGVAIIKRNGIFSFTIAQSKLLSHGRVQQHTPHDEQRYVYRDFSRNGPGIIAGIDYHTLSWQNRSVNLDTISLESGRVVTGVKFVVNDGHLGIKIRSTKFDFNSGTLFNEQEWVGKGYRDRSILLLDRPEPNRYSDIYGAYLSEADFRPNTFIKFRPSDPDKDAGQSTVPFIDDQMVLTKNLAPLSGIGLYYKGKQGTGGYIAPLTITYEWSVHIEGDLVSHIPGDSLLPRTENNFINSTSGDKS